ncbi:MAG: hypothetical protein AAFY17_05680 [Cyanobacteria bacterium J06642_11]
MDFDSVKTDIVRNDYTMTIVGTYGYMPPEQFGGNARPASDLYSLGATLIYAATGQHPADLPQKNLRIAFEDQVSLSDNFVAWLQWMTNPNLDRRLKSATQAIEALKDHQGWRVSAATKPRPQLSTKPVNSLIVVNQTQSTKTLEITIPPQGVNPVFLVLFFVVGVPLGLVTAGILVLVMVGTGASMLLYTLPAGLGAFLTVLPFILTSSRQVQLCIDENTIESIGGLAGSHNQRAPRSGVRLVSRKSSVLLTTAAHTFVLPVATPEEREWLVHTLGQWLQR